MPHAFTPYVEDGTLTLCDRGDLWQTLPNEHEVTRYSHFGPVEDVAETQLPPKYRPALERLRRRWIERPREDQRGDVLHSYRLGLRRGDDTWAP